jgi:hypothetical protein
MKLFLLLLILTSCSLVQFEAEMIKKSEVTKSFKFQNKLVGKDEFIYRHWHFLVFFSNEYNNLPNVYKKVHKLCPDNDFVTNVKVTRDVVIFPLIFSLNTYVFEGECRE